MIPSIIRSGIALAVMILANGCHPSPERGSPQSGRASSNSAQDAAPSLAGDWQVASVDGRRLVGVSLKGRDGMLVWEPACAGWSIPFEQDGTALRFITRKPSPEGELHVVCSIGYPDAVPTVFRILPLIQRMEVPSQGHISLSGGEHVIMLERPVPRSAWPVRTLKGRWTVSSIDGRKMANSALAFEADESTIHWLPRCAAQNRSYVIENDRILVFAAPTVPVPPPGAAAPPPVCALPIHPDLETAFTAMGAADSVRLLKGGSIAIDGNGHEVILTEWKQ